MGVYINPGNAAFTDIRNSTYVDKTEMISTVNARIGTKGKLLCLSRPRRFGKTFAAQMLCAYYDRSCNSSALFDDLAIAADPGYTDHLNRYNVLCLDIAAVKPSTDGFSQLVEHLTKVVGDELHRMHPEIPAGAPLADALAQAVEITGTKFVAIIDEWDAPIREASSHAEAYLEFLRSLFKNGTVTDKVFACAYMTGILPIKKEKGQSAISDFREFSVIDPGPFAPCIGFLERDVEALCDQSHMDFAEMKRWYDGYTFGGQASVYNSYAVMQALESRRFGSYWRQTSAADMILTYIDLDVDGLQGDVVRLMAGDELDVDTTGFKNDTAHLQDKNDALTLMAHLGYLTYEDELYGTGTVRIPNQEIRTEFEKMLRRATHPRLVERVRESDALLEATRALDGEAVAEAIARIHDSNYAPQFYNNEQALRHTVKMAYIGAVDHYARVEEMPSGHGLADVAYIPRRRSALPAMLVELKWNREAGGAISQIHDRNYPAVLRDLSCDLLLVGIAYDEKTKHHTCSIERVPGTYE